MSSNDLPLLFVGSANTYSGGTEVQAGANLVIASASVLGSGGLDLVGSLTVPATLSTTADMTISNPITVTGDPVFNVSPGTTTTVATGISGAGDVVVSGGGTLNLTAANTYTGATTINNGSTLALSGNGAISTSAAVTNAGTFNVSGAGNTVALGGSYSQSSTGNLILSAAPGAFQKVTVGGTANLNGGLTLNASAGNYSMGKYTLMTANGVSGNFSSFSSNLASVTPLGFSLGYDANDVYLYLTPASGYTLQSLQQNAQALGTVFNMQTAALQAALSYDCVKYDENNLCVSVGGRYTYAGVDPSGNAQAGVVIVGYRPTPSTRIGVFADRSIDINTPSGISQSKTIPTWGLFANWNMNQDGNGLGIQAAAVFSSSQLSISRTASAYTESAQGDTQLSGRAYLLQANYATPVTDDVKLIPYFGVRYSRVNTNAYTEGMTSQASWPITYNAVAQNTLSALAGLGVSSKLADKTTGIVSAGLQQNLKYSMDNYTGTSNIPGVTGFNVQMPDHTNSLPMASGSVFYDVTKNERLSLNAQWQRQPFSHTGTTSVIASYTMGF